jgi:hypothetical protein
LGNSKNISLYSWYSDKDCNDWWLKKKKGFWLDVMKWGTGGTRWWRRRRQSNGQRALWMTHLERRPQDENPIRYLIRILSKILSRILVRFLLKILNRKMALSGRISDATFIVFHRVVRQLLR